jgi:DNA primase
MSTSFLDFNDLKSRVSIEQVLQLLGITLKQYNSQLRGCCPIHKGTDQCGFVVTPAKGLYYCFGGCGGGDIIKLVSKLHQCDAKEAARWIADGTGTVPPNPTVPRKGTVPPEQKVGFNPLSYLEASHESLAGLDVAASTFEAFGAGYAPKGILRGRLAISVHSRDGVLLAYCGRTVKNESPTLLFPSGFDPHSTIFNAHRGVMEGELYLVRDPLDVLKAFESGIEHVVSFLTDGITAQQLEQLSSLMGEKKIDTLSFF